MIKDTVLDIEDIKRIGVTLGDKVTLLEIDNAMHDIFLSQKQWRTFSCHGRRMNHKTPEI
jgi:hypothetical protein